MKKNIYIKIRNKVAFNSKNLLNRKKSFWDKLYNIQGDPKVAQINM